MDDLVWPVELFRPRTEAWPIVGAAVESGRPLVGSTPQRSSFGGGGMLTCRLNGIRLRTREQIAAWEAIEARLDNGATPIVVPCCQRVFSPVPKGVLQPSAIPHSDGSLFSDGSGYGQDMVSVIVTAAATFRDTKLSIAVAGGRPLIGNERISINHPVAGWRLYKIVGVEETSAAGETTGYDVMIRVPLRDDVAAGTEVETRRPRCVMRLSKADGMDADLELGRFKDGAVEFEEDFSAMRGFA